MKFTRTLIILESNIRLIDCINRPENLIDRAIELGLGGIAITDHECLSSHIKVNKYAQKIREKYPSFKVALGNEIYLTGSREMGQKYYHFILIAKNAQGHKALRELSSRAWMLSYFDRGQERVPTLYDELRDVVNRYPNSLIATTACLGGELSTLTAMLIKCEKNGNQELAKEYHNQIINFILYCQELFGDDFYIECAPGCSKEQIAVNQRLISIAQAFNVKMVIGTDAHFLKKEDRYVHKSYLNSHDGDREVDAFYEYSYLQTTDEIMENLHQSSYDNLFIEQLFMNSMEIYNKIENYSLLHSQQIPRVTVENYKPNQWWSGAEMAEYPVLMSMFTSDDIYERYWVNTCWNKLQERKGLWSDNLNYVARLEEEARTKRVIGKALDTNMFLYPITLKHYIDMFWECGSIVGAGRGSSCSGLNHYLLDVTQLDPIEWDLPWFRYMNEERTEIGDIDIDLCPSKRPLILNKIKQERGQNFNENIDDLSRRNLGCTLVATFGTESTKSTILTSCRGYRSEEYPMGIDIDTAQYLSSLVPEERGFLWSLEELLNGDKEKGRKPVKTFINEVNKYPGLIEIMKGIEGLISRRGSHPSGVILFDEDPYEFGCFMKTPSGDIITQYDLHDAEAAGLTKYDFLVTEVQDKLAETIRLLQKYGEINSTLTLREVYDKYFHPSVLPILDKTVWDAIAEGSVLNIFQFDSDVGSQAAKKIRPKNMQELADSNGLMRLMAESKGAETPLDKYIRFKNNISLWYEEMDRYGLTADEQKILERYFKQSYGVPPSQEQLMLMLMDPDICGFTLGEANSARKIVGKKLIAKVPELHQKVLDQASSKAMGEYVWKCGIGPQMSYSFSIIHALAYSFIGFQTAYIATHWNPIYWNCACLIVNSGALEEPESEIVDIYEKEDDDEYTYEDINRKEKKKTKTVDYAKNAKALGDIISKGIKISLVDINKSNAGFEPDIENNQILFGLKALTGVNNEVISQIMAGRPYKDIKDFMVRCPQNKRIMIALIKAGAFDNLAEEWSKETGYPARILVMTYYISQVCEPKNKITLQNFNGLIEKELIPSSMEYYKQVFEFNKFLKKNTKVGRYFVFNDICIQFFEKHFSDYYDNNIEIINENVCILQKKWDKIYQKEMDNVREWIADNQTSILNELNTMLFAETWNKYATGSLSAWEMESLCFYYNEHELAHVDTDRYGIVNFQDLPTEPEVDYYFKRNGKNIPIYKLYKIIGTVISKNDSKSSISILTVGGIVTVKFTKDYYAMFKKQISEVRPDGTKKVIEKGWFTRGTKVFCTGFRRGDTFVTKTYANTPTHQLYKITHLNEDGSIEVEHERG